MRLALAFLLLPSLSSADPCKDIFNASEPPPLSACLAEHPTVILSGLVGLAAGGEGTSGVTGFVRADIPLGRFRLEGRARYHQQGMLQLDALAGIVLSHRYGTGRAWYVSNVVDSPGIRTTTYTGSSTVLRRDLVLAGGLKTVFGKVDTESTTVAMGALGLQRHLATGFGSHSVIEAFALYGESKVGGMAAWHNSIPPTGGVVFGMEAGLLPGESLGTIYWAMLELGFSFER